MFRVGDFVTMDFTIIHAGFFTFFTTSGIPNIRSRTSSPTNGRIGKVYEVLIDGRIPESRFDVVYAVYWLDSNEGTRVYGTNLKKASMFAVIYYSLIRVMKDV